MISGQRGVPVAEGLKIAVLTLFLYDYLLTLPREVEVMWPRLHHLSTVLYYMIRVLPVGGLISGLTLSSATPHCDVVVRAVGCLTILARVGIAVTLTARTYAIWSRNRTILLVLGSLGMATVLVDGFQVAVDTCATISFKWVLINAGVRLAFEASVVGLTVHETLRAYRLPRGLEALRGNNLTSFVLRNGIIYFVCVFMLELSSLLVYSLDLNQFIGAAGSFPLPVAAILISRFLLDLRHLNVHPDGTTEKSIPPTSFRFASQNIHSALIDNFGNSEGTIKDSFNDDIKLEEVSYSPPQIGHGVRTDRIIVAGMHSNQAAVHPERYFDGNEEGMQERYRHMSGDVLFDRS